MWGPSIVGFGSYTYKYESGHSGEACLVGLAVRGRELVVYIDASHPAQVDLLARLGRHKMGKSCLYIKRLAELDVAVLEALIARSVAEVKRRYPNTIDSTPVARSDSGRRSGLARSQSRATRSQLRKKRTASSKPRR